MTTKIRISFGVSLALNVLLIGIFLGMLSYRFVWQENPEREINALLLQLPDNQHRLVEDTLRVIWDDKETTRAQIAENKKEMLRIFAAEPLDEQRFLKQAEQCGDTEKQAKLRRARLFEELGRQLNPKERAIVAKIAAYPPPDSSNIMYIK
jgi:uncharacterized membrane protein